MQYLFGLIGHPVSQSMSPPLHKAALSYFGLEGDYKLFDVEASALQEKLEQLKADGLRGFNITIPHKIAVYKLCHKLTEQAQIVGAANTVLFDADGQMTGHNTDYMGLHDALVDVIDERRDAACILGAGGAAKAAIRVFEKLGFENVVVIARDMEKASQTLGLNDARRSDFRIQISLKSVDDFSNGLSDFLNPVSLIVNCLPIGQTIAEVPQWLGKLLSSSISPSTYVYDMVYSKTQLETPLVAAAHAAGLNGSDGMSMLVHQAAHAFSFWTGQMPPYSVMEHAFLNAKTQDFR